jgi:hypothetical protein
MNENPANMDAMIKTCRGSRPWVVALSITHLAITFATAALSSQIHHRFQVEVYLHSILPSSLADCVSSILGNWLLGIQVGQIVLIASWGAFADQHAFLRIPRLLTLVAWFSLLGFLGEYAIEGEIVKFLVEEHFAYTLILVLIPVITLFVFRAASARQFLYRNSQQRKHGWQFNIRRLLLITAEVAALLALARVVLPRNFRLNEVWLALTELQTLEIIPAAVSTTVLPVVFFGLARQRSWRGYLLLGLYLWIPVLVLTSLHMAAARRLLPISVDSWWWPEIYASSSGFWSAHLSAAATILFTFYLLRRIGYDFRRRDELPLADGRNSSNARNSAASASA